MDCEVILTSLLTKSFGLLAWPPLSLLCPLLVSIRDMESGSHSSNRRCLTFWVIFSLFKIMEKELAGLFDWLPWWPHMIGMATILLVLPYFRGASYIYEYFRKQYCSDDGWKRYWNISSQKSTSFKLDNHSTLVNVSNSQSTKSQMPEKTSVMNQGGYGLGCDLTERNHNRSTCKKKAQKEWGCAVCQITTSGENCLAAHLQGKKHKANSNNLSVQLSITETSYMLPSMASHKRTKGMVLLNNLNQIANLLPVSRTVRWCGWIKPEFGWTKLNTDGSIHKENASFGGLLRDYKGEPLCAFVSKAPQGDIFLAELWAIWRGLVLAWGQGVKVVWVESDSMSVVKTINREQPSGLKGNRCLRCIWKLLRKFDKYQVSHTWRETNRAADYLAKMVIRGNDVVLWPDDFPDSLCIIIKEDAKGKKYLRR